MKPKPINNRVTEMTGVDYPILQAPMGWIARAQLASAVSNSGAMGIIETSSGDFDAIQEEVRKMHELTDKPFGMNVALAFVKGTNVIDFVIEQGIKFVTTSSGSPDLCTKDFQEAGIKVFHVVPTLDMALKALDAGVDGLVVEGGEGGGFKNPRPVSTMVLLPLIRERTDVPIIAAGGRVCHGSRGCSVGDGHVELFGFTGSSELEKRNLRGERNGYRFLKPARSACASSDAYRPHGRTGTFGTVPTV